MAINRVGRQIAVATDGEHIGPPKLQRVRWLVYAVLTPILAVAVNDEVPQQHQIEHELSVGIGWPYGAHEDELEKIIQAFAAFFEGHAAADHPVLDGPLSM